MSVDLLTNLKKAEVWLEAVKAAYYPYRRNAPKNTDFLYYTSKEQYENAVADAEAEVYAAYECVSSMESGLR